MESQQDGLTCLPKFYILGVKMMREVVREIQGQYRILFPQHTADPFTFLNYHLQTGGPLGSDLGGLGLLVPLQYFLQLLQ